MLQKYHPNPLSHFLALHNSQATHHNVVDAHTLASTLANGHAQFQQHQQQQQHANPALLTQSHHTQTTHNHAAIELAAQHLNSHNSPTQLQREHHLQQQPHNNNNNNSNNNNNNNSNQLLHHHHHHNPRISQNHHHQHHHHAQQLIEAAAAVTANTTLDAGKSFTIAAILGLQKSAMENTRKEYANNVINLSLNAASHHHHQHHHHQQQQQHELNNSNSNISILQPPTNCTPPSDVDDEQQSHQHPHEARHESLNSNNTNNCSNNNRDVSIPNANKLNICNSFNNSTSNNTSNNNNTTALNNPVNSFNCDNNNATAATAAASVLMNRYLPSAMANVGAASTVVATAPSLVSFAASPIMTHQQHARANSFVAAAAAAAAAAAVSGAPSALQSLQQLHQQHAHQTSLSFQREKLKADHNSKKSSLKNKRVRTIFTPEQLERLEAEFERQQYMVGPERLYLAHTLQLTEAQVKVWFQNRRIKWRKHHLEITQQRLALLRQTQIATNANGNSETVTINIDTNDEECDDIKREELRDLNESRQDTESELSICNDSMDADSILDADDET